MPPKRRRRKVDKDVESERLEETKPDPQPHEELWISDGSIVLATDVHLYRVHKSTLAKYSTVLSDMFEIPSGGANTECWEGIPIVKMVGDKDDEVCELVRALYDRNFRDSVEDFNLSRLTSLLSISTKYDFQDVRADVIQYLETIFPDTHENYEALEGSMTISDSQLFQMLPVAHRCDVLSILPVLYLRCARTPVERSVELIRILDVPEECTINLLAGREWYNSYSLRKHLQCMLSNKCCAEWFRSRALECILTTVPLKSLLDVSGRGVLNNSIPSVCEACEHQYLHRIKLAKESVWKNLPLKFLKKSWQEIRGDTNMDVEA